MSADDHGLHALGRRVAAPDAPDSAILETFENPSPEADYAVTLDCPEFTSMCPVTGQPDFGRWVIDYCPDARCIESKSLKLYLASFRNEGCFWEALTGRIAADVHAATGAKWLRLRGFMAPRGGIAITTAVVLGDAELAERMLRLL